MRKLLLLLTVVVTLFGATSCSLQSPMTTNLNQNSTEVVLQDNNYTIVQKVRGEAESSYVFCIGGFRKAGLIEEARANMLENANMIGSSKAIINETVEMEVTSYLGVYNVLTVTVSGFVVEFNK